MPDERDVIAGLAAAASIAALGAAAAAATAEAVELFPILQDEQGLRSQQLNEQGEAIVRQKHSQQQATSAGQGGPVG